MATNCVLHRYPNKRELSSIELELSPTNNLRKRGKLEKKDDSSLRSRSAVVERRGKCGGESEKTKDSSENTPSSLKFKHRQFSKEELKHTREKEIHWPDFSTSEEESEESDEDDVRTEKEHDNTEGLEFTRKGLDAMLGKPLIGLGKAL